MLHLKLLISALFFMVIYTQKKPGFIPRFCYFFPSHFYSSNCNCPYPWWWLLFHGRLMHTWHFGKMNQKAVFALCTFARTRIIILWSDRTMLFVDDKCVITFYPKARFQLYIFRCCLNLYLIPPWTLSWSSSLHIDVDETETQAWRSSPKHIILTSLPVTM